MINNNKIGNWMTFCFTSVVSDKLSRVYFAPYGGSITYMSSKRDTTTKKKKKKQEGEGLQQRSHFNMAELEGKCAAPTVKSA